MSATSASRAASRFWMLAESVGNDCRIRKLVLFSSVTGFFQNIRSESIVVSAVFWIFAIVIEMKEKYSV